MAKLRSRVRRESEGTSFLLKTMEPALYPGENTTLAHLVL
jgi:hypothetical protein